ncbi:lysosomal proton-coupled steroid conjugate and bile acid symporter SLC46A3 [Salvelinus alpinus]
MQSLNLVALVPPLLGELLFALCYATVSHLSLSLGYLLGASFLAGVMGGPTALLGGSFAYIADLCEGEGGGGRTVRMAALEMLLGVLSGLASLCTGFYIQTAGFTWPFITAAVLHLINLVYTAWVLQETVERPSHTDSSSSPSSSSPTPFGVGSARFLQREALIGRFQGVYLLFTASPRRRKTILGLILAAFAFYTVSKLGGMSIFILYELNAPLCWSEVLVGYGSALSTLIYLGSFAGVSLLSRCLRDGYIVLLGLLSVAAGLLMAAFAKNTLLMFLVRLPLLLSIMPAPVLRSMMSKIVLRSEQGAVFACVAFVEMLSIGVGITVFSSTYASTVSWFPGFSFLLASAIALIPAVLIGVVMCLRLDKDEEASRLTADDNEEEEETESCGQSLQLPH